MNDEHEKRILYAVACEQLVDGQTVIPQMVYLHAVDGAHARWQFTQDPIHRKHFRIVAIAPVIGYNVLDNHGDELSV